MQTDRSQTAPRMALLLACLAAAGSAAADDFYDAYQTPHASWSLLAGATRTDNATLEPNGPSDTIATAGFGGSLYRDTGRLKADLDGLVYYEDYLDGTFKGDWLGNFRGLVSYAIVPESFTWVVQDSFGQLNTNPFLPTIPTYRINGNVASTGPDGYLHFGSDAGLLLGARYTQSDFQSNPVARIDDQSLSANLGLIKHLSQATAVSLNASATRLEYRVPGHPGFDQAELFGRYDSRNARSGLSLDAGVTKLRDSVTGSTVQDPLLRLTLFHRLTPSWNVNLSAGQQFENTGSALAGALGATQVVNGQVVPVGTGVPPPGTGGVTADVALSQAPFRSDYATLAFDFVRPRTSFGLHGHLERQRYQFGASGLDRDLGDVGATFGRQLRPSLSLRASVDYWRRTAAEGLPGDRTKLGDLAFEWRTGAMLAVSFGYDRQDRAADTGGFSYVVNQVYLNFTYGPPKRGIAFQPPGSAAPSTATPPL